MYRIVFVGHKHHGKDFIAEIISKVLEQPYLPTTYELLSLDYSKAFIEKHGYGNVHDTFTNRDSIRHELQQHLREYVEGDPARLIRHVLNKSGIYTGLRDPYQLESAQKEGIIDLTVYVDASERIGANDTTMLITPDMADIVIDNNGTKNHAKQQISDIFFLLNDKTHMSRRS